MDLSPYVGRVISHTYDPGFIVLSYIVSLAGCWTALELLHRRTSAHGYYNWYILIGAACSMGSVAIWSMHFIGNRAIVMAENQGDLQIQYSPGFTAGSFFLPICGVGMAFYFFSVSEKVSIFGTLSGGLMVGLAVCGMHYMGQGGISNYTPSYAWPYVLGSAIIAIATSTVVLGVFFYFKSIWTSSWPKRACCASLLALAVSGMHWVATFGTTYRLKSDVIGNTNGLSRHAIVVVVICLSMSTCVILIAFTYIGQRSRQRSANRAQQVVLACATFDTDGRLLVTPEGLLPCRKITNSYIERTFEDVFDVDHPVFCWIFRASRCWREVKDLIPGIRDHLRTSSQMKPLRSSATSDTIVTAGSENDYSTIFKELFFLAANDLAESLQEPLENVGNLFDEIMCTGAVKYTSKSHTLFGRSAPNQLDQAEKGDNFKVFGRGQLLFAVRQVSRAGSMRLQAAGYRFANISNVIEFLARSMEVTRSDLAARLERMYDYTTNERILEPGVHLACFALRPLIHRGFDVLVQKKARNLLPTFPLPISKLEKWQLDMLAQMDNWTVATCLERLRGRSLSANQQEQQFVRQLYDGITSLADQIESHLFDDARLIARPYAVPSLSDTQKSEEALLIAFRVIASAHEHSAVNTRYEFGSLRLFVTQQRTHKGYADHHIFARRIQRDFAHMAERQRHTEDTFVSSPRQSIYTAHRSFKRRQSSSPARSRRWPARIWSAGCGAVAGDNSSEKNLVHESPSQNCRRAHMSDDTNVRVIEINRESRSVDVEMGHLELDHDIFEGYEEIETYVEQLVALTARERIRH